MVNVFVSSFNPKKAAKALPNLLCQRMCLEAAEILCGAQWNMRLGLDKTPSRLEVPDAPHLPPYRRSLGQRKHPIVLWAMADRAHYVWLLRHMAALAEEYKLRYPGSGFPSPYLNTYEWLQLRSHKIPTAYDYTPVQASDLMYYGAFNQKDFLQFSMDIRVQYRLSLLYKWLYEYSRNHSWAPRKPPEWAFNKEYRAILRDIYGKPTTPTSKGELRRR